MSDRPPDLTLLAKFEQGLNVRRPETSRIPARVLGYGEISTVLEIQSAAAEGLAFKRMPMFRDETEAAQHEVLYREYVDVLQNQIDLQVCASLPGREADGIRAARSQNVIDAPSHCYLHDIRQLTVVQAPPILEGFYILPALHYALPKLSVRQPRRIWVLRKMWHAAEPTGRSAVSRGS